MPQRPTAFVVGAVAIILALLVVSAIAQLQASDTASRMARSLATSDTAERLLGVVRDAETGQRGYLLTGQDSYLGPFTAAQGSAGSIYDRLTQLVAGRSDQADRVAALKVPIDSKMAELAQTVQMATNGDRDGALKIVADGAGKTSMDDFRARIAEIETVEVSTRGRLSDAEALRRSIDITAFVLAVIGLILLGWWLLRSGQIRALQLEDLNATLEQRVAERTAALQKEQSRVELLLHDMNHRVGNNLSVVAAILALQRRKSSNPEVQLALERAQERIAAIGASQRRLRLNLDTDDVEAPQFFGAVVEDLRRGVDGRPVTIETAIDEVRLPGRDAVTYGVLVNELVTNSIKHAFPDGTSGTITLAVRSGGDGTIVVEVADDGVGMAAEEGQGLGTTIFSNLARSLGAEVKAGPAAPGTARPGLRTTFVATPVSRGAE
ncbi:MAG TPA: CHASE3 domain-containing protein [Devosia sp.]|nr:CHASE3 domain-containing protein [Devosia sp.]